MFVLKTPVNGGVGRLDGHVTLFRIGSIVQTRQAKIWLQPAWMFRCSALYSRHQNCINILHSFSNKASPLALALG